MKLRLIYLWKYHALGAAVEKCRMKRIEKKKKTLGRQQWNKSSEMGILLCMKKIVRGRNGTPASEATDRPTHAHYCLDGADKCANDILGWRLYDQLYGL